MRECTGNLFDLAADAYCITTNGFVTTQGANPMGRGCAAEAKARWPGIQMVLGHQIQNFGNHVFMLTDRNEAGEWVLHTPGAWTDHICPGAIISFPTKEHWKDPSPIKLIERSAEELVGLAHAFALETILIPRPGCGMGGLDWDEVRPMLHGILDDRFCAVTWG